MRLVDQNHADLHVWETPPTPPLWPIHVLEPKRFSPGFLFFLLVKLVSLTPPPPCPPS